MDIIVENISKSYDSQVVLENFSCRFPEKRVSCIMGKSGCGKTTLVNILLSIEKPDAGTVSGMPKGRIGAVFQENRLCENLSAAANLRLACKRRLTEEEIQKAFRAVALEEARRKPVRELSGGMRRRVAILRALMAEADCILMDEPLRGLDEETKRRTIRYILECIRDKTLIFVTHDEEEAGLLGAEKILRMQPGMRTDK